MIEIDEGIQVLIRRVDIKWKKDERGKKIRNKRGEKIRDKDVTGDEIEPGEDGFLGEAVIARGEERPKDGSFPDKFLLEVSYPRTAQVFCCTSQGEKLPLCGDKSKKRNYEAEKFTGIKPIITERGDRVVNTLKVARRYHKAYTRQEVQAQLMSQKPPDEEFYVAPRYPQNSLKVFVLKDEHLVLSEIGIVSQFGRFYLTAQKTFEAVVGLVNGKLFVQKVYGSDMLAANKDLHELLTRLNKDEISPLTLKEFANEPRAVLLTPLVVEKGDGVVEWYSDTSGLVAIRLRNGQTGGAMWFHVESPKGFSERSRVRLESGQHVLIEHKVPPDPNSGTDFNFFLKGVKPID